jgi:glycosylphosphatidylinositol transamidase
MALATIPRLNVVRLRSYASRLSLFTRLVIGLVALLWLVSLQHVWDVRQWGALIPNKIAISTCSSFTRVFSLSGSMLTPHLPVYRTNTFPLIHAGFFHASLNLLALIPLLERFEAENGSLTSLLLFFGRQF